MLLKMNVSEIKPAVVIVSCSNTKPKSLIKLITRSTTINEDDPDNINTSWSIDTKYYRAEINVHGITENFQRTDEFDDTVEALLVHVDTNKDTGLDDLHKWQNIESKCNPEIKLLVSNYCTNDTKVSKTEATEWCLKHGFEFIELYPNMSKNKDDTNEEIIKEKVGVERIIEALQTHVWPNLKMKDHKFEVVNRISNESEPAQTNDSGQSNGGTKKPDADSDSKGGLEDFLTSEGTDDFTELFSQLHMMKESIQSVPVRQRKQCAEQMVTAFWKAIGGDEEEIEDL